MTAIAAAPAAAASGPDPTGPVFLVVVPDRAAADRLPAAARQARRAGASLLVALARPRPGFTTDAVIARHIAVRAQEGSVRLQQVAHQMLYGSGVDYEIVPMTYRDSRAPAKRERRIAAAVNRLAHRRGATPLPAPAMPPMPTAPQPASPSNASSGRPAHVVAVLPDSAEAVRVARVATGLARAAGLPLALVVPMPALEPDVDPEDLTRGYARIGEDMAAIAGRVRPTLDLVGLTARVYCAPYRSAGTAAGLHLSMAGAVEKVARRLRAQAVVVCATDPFLPQIRMPAEMLHVVEPARHDLPDDTAHPVLEGRT